jgi:AcrR family transcriptional regulator
MGDVAKRAGVGVGTLYHHFADKHAMLLELIDCFGDRLATQRRSDLDFAAFLGKDPRAAFATWLRKAHARLRARPSLYLVVLAVAGRDDEVRRRYQRVEQVAVDRLTALIEFGQRNGLMRASIDAHAAAFLIHNNLDMAAIQLFLREHSAGGIAPALRGGAMSTPDPERVVAELTDLICRYVLEDKP